MKVKNLLTYGGVVALSTLFVPEGRSSCPNPLNEEQIRNLHATQAQIVDLEDQGPWAYIAATPNFGAPGTQVPQTILSGSESRGDELVCMYADHNGSEWYILSQKAQE